MAVDVSKIPNNNKFDPVREAILELEAEITGGALPTLDSVTDNGAVTTNTITIGGLEVEGAVSEIILTDTSASPDGGTVKLTNTNTDFIINVDPDNVGNSSTIQFELDGTERMRINATGIGIGTPSPSVAFQVNSATANDVAIFESSDSTASVYIKDNTGSSRLRQSAEGFIIDSDYGNALVNSYIGFNVDGSQKMVLTDDGFLGIGTTSPAENLHISGTTAALRIDNNGAEEISIYAGFSTFGNYFQNYNRSAGVYEKETHRATEYVWNGSGGQELVRIDISGRLGIGTIPNAAAQLHVKDNDGAEIRIEDNTSTTFEVLRFIGDTGTYEKGLIGYNSANAFDADSLHLFNLAGDVVFRANVNGNSTERMRILAAGGDVGINTSSPERKLHVVDGTTQGVARFQNSSPTSVFIDFKDANTTADNKVRVGARGDDLSLYAGGGERIRVASGGNVGLGTTSPSVELEVASAAPQVRLTDTGGGYGEVGSANGHLFLHADRGNTIASSYISFSVDDDEKARITDDGYLGIGVTSPDKPLEIFKLNDATIRLNYGSITSNDAEDYYGGVEFYADGGSFGQPTVSSYVRAIHTRAGTAHTNADSGLIFGTSTATNNTAATERMRIESVTGNVGIGTTPNAASKLHVKDNDGAEIRIEDSTTTSFEVLRLMGDSSTYEKYLIGYNSANTFSPDNLHLVNAGGAIIFATESAGGATERMRIKDSGEVGIGATNPAYTLDVNGTAGFRSSTYIYDATLYAYNSTSGAYFAMLTDNSGIGYLNMTGGENLVLNNSGGNVGIGNVLPTETLTVNGTGQFNDTLYLEANDSLAFEGGKHWITYNDGAGNFNLRVGHKDNSSGTEECTEAGYIMHDEWLQSSGQRQFLISDASMSVGGLIGTDANWNLAMQYSNSGVFLYYDGDERLRTTNAGVQITGSLDFSGVITMDNGASITSDAGAQLITTNVGETWTVRNGGGSDPILTLQDSLTNVLTTFDYRGYLGIGTTPTSPLHVSSGANRTITLDFTTTTGDYTWASFKQSGTEQYRIWGSNANNYLSFYNDIAGSHMITLASNAYVGIATTTPTQRLEVNGVGLFTGTSLTGNTQTGVYILDQSIYSLDGGNARPLNIYGQTLGFYTGTSYSQTAVIDANGEMGIGTTNPQRILHLSTPNGPTVLRLSDAGATTDAQVNAYIEFYRGNNTNRVGYIGYPSSANESITYNNQTSGGNHRFMVNGDGNALVVDSSGNTGIGTDAPSYKLDVNGGAAFRDTSYLFNAPLYGYDTTSGTYLQFYNISGTGYIRMTGGENLALQTNGGYVGIGTDTPSTNLEVYDTANPTLRLQTTGTANQGSIQFGDAADADVGIINYVHDTNKMRFFTNASEQMVITGDGFVGVGVQNPSYQLEVTRSASNLLANFYSTSNVSSFVNIGTSTNTSFANIGLTSDNGTAQIWNAGSTYTSFAGANSMNFYAPSGVSMAWHPNGTANQMVLSTSGTLSVVGDIVGYSSSDKALKENVKPIEDALEKISKIGGYEFDWNDKQDVYEGHDVGVIAQEIEDVLPEVVTTRDNGYKAVKYEKLAPLLIQAIKEQQEIIEDLKAEIRHIKTLF